MRVGRWLPFLAGVLAIGACGGTELGRSGDTIGPAAPGPGGEGGAGGEGGEGGVGGLVQGSAGMGGTGGTGVDLEPGPGPWPLVDLVHYGEEQGLPDRVIGIGVDDAQNLYAIDGEALYALPAGGERFVRTDAGGQFELGWPVSSVAGGEPGRVYLGFLAPEGAPEELSEEDKLYGDVDRMELNPDGTVAFEFHYQLQNSNARWMDHTRSILSLSRVVGGPRHGDLYAASNHGVTLIRGDDYADHRHAVFPDENGSQATQYVWTTNIDPAGNLLFGGHWKVAAIGPAPDYLPGWLDHETSPWLVDTWAENLGPLEDPDEIIAIAGDLARNRLWIGTRAKGLSAVQLQPRRWWSIEDTPDREITGLELDPDGSLWVGTGSHGLWRLDAAGRSWERSRHLPATARVFQLYLDETVSPWAIYAATDSGLYVLREP